jgi:plastocyanin
MAPSAAHSSEIKIYANYLEFSPQAIQAAVGDRVTWINNSGVMHEIYFPENPTDTQEPRLHYVLPSNRSVSIIVSKPGAYDYFCRWHGMHGSIHVVRQPSN